jgi:hypothetical protein
MSPVTQRQTCLFWRCRALAALVSENSLWRLIIKAVSIKAERTLSNLHKSFSEVILPAVPRTRDSLEVLDGGVR